VKQINHFCTYFDQRYLPNALALYESLKKVSYNFKLWALCFDEVSYQRISDLKEVTIQPVSINEFLNIDKELRIAKENRSLIEFYFTCTPSLPLYIFNHFSGLDQITYLDADLFFFQNPEPIFEEINKASIAIIPHRFPNKLKYLEENGIYNVGWLTFNRDSEGLECLTRWRNQCIEWCFDYIDESRFADQGYLNEWPRLFKNISIIQHKGANLAPWNFSQYKINSLDKVIWIDEDPLIFYHFQSLVRLKFGFYKLNFGKYKSTPTQVLKEKIYRPYLKILEKNFLSENLYKLNRIRNTMDSFDFDLKDDVKTKNIFKVYFSIFKNILKGDFMFPWDY
jgi:hypothetical protein